MAFLNEIVSDAHIVESIYGATALEVQDQLLKARTDRAAGLPVVMERQTIAQFLQDWLENSVKPSVRPLTHEQYRQHVKLYLARPAGVNSQPVAFCSIGRSRAR